MKEFTLTMLFKCPTCCSENTQRFSVAHESGISSVNYSSTENGVYFGNGGIMFKKGTSHTTGTKQTWLSTRTAPPQRQHTWSLLFGVIYVVIPWAIISIPICIYLFKFSIQTTDFIWKAGAWLLFLWICYEIYRSRKFNKTQLPLLMDKWHRTFICLRCGHIFLSNK